VYTVERWPDNRVNARICDREHELVDADKCLLGGSHGEAMVLGAGHDWGCKFSEAGL
jgi:hypothetical protein